MGSLKPRQISKKLGLDVSCVYSDILNIKRIEREEKEADCVTVTDDGQVTVPLFWGLPV